jgi:Secretion system C-terminal sorting domain
MFIGRSRIPLTFILSSFLIVVSLSAFAEDLDPLRTTTLIDFDDLEANPYFTGDGGLYDEYEYLGVIFTYDSEVLNEGANLGVSNYSSPNYLAISTNEGMEPVEWIYFDPPVTYVSILAGHASAGTITMSAYDPEGADYGDAIITGTSELQTISLEFNLIGSVRLAFTGTVCCFDDLVISSDNYRIALDLTPTYSYVPVEGGNVVYDAHLLNQESLFVPGLRYQTFAVLPDNQTFGPIDDIPFVLTPFMDHQVFGLTVTVPDYAPGGPYTFEARAGVPGIPAMQVTDSFEFHKQYPYLYEDFEDGIAQDFSWDVGDFGLYGIEDGSAWMDMFFAGQDWGSGTYTGSIYNNDFYVSTIITQNFNFYSEGMQFLGSGAPGDDYSGYAMYFAQTSYSVWEYFDGVPYNIIGWTNAPISQQYGVQNGMEVIGDNTTYDIYINYLYFGSFTEYSFTSGYVGITTALDNYSYFEQLSCSDDTPARYASRPEIGDPDPVLRDHMYRVITDPADYYTPGVAFDRSAEINAENAARHNSMEFVREDWKGSGFSTSSQDNSAVGVASDFNLSPAYPNPFNAVTTVTVALPETSDLTVTVYNTLGQQVAELVNGSVNAGTQTLTFDASDLSSGIYFVQATVPGKLDAMQKIVLVK